MLKNYLKNAWRNLLRNKAFSALNVAGLAISLTAFILLVIISIVIASPVAYYFMHRWLTDFAYRINISIWFFLLAGFTAVFVALITISFQAIKAAVSNPVKSLRTE